MALSPGTRFGAYEILAAIGAGGMGEVYRARDGKLNRDVAIKVLPDAVANDPERLARFRREAQLLASLNHQNIAHIYGLEEGRAGQAGTASVFIVMELVEGDDLSQRIARGRLPLDEALTIARQVADALEVAHDQGIIHRDLKPANVKVRPDGAVKVLDFGLAKAIEGAGEAGRAGGAGRNISLSPTITSPAMTHAGIILGTAAYMSPEQARGKPVDKRSDIWAFGCVLYEMLTGRRAFGGDEVTDTLAFVITKEVDWTALPADCPQSIRAVIRRCLEKDRARRRGDIHDVKLDIDEAMATPASTVTVSVIDAGRDQRGKWLRALPWAIALSLGMALVFVLAEWAPWRAAVSPAPPMRLNAELGSDASLVTILGDTALLSPDGKVLAFVAQKAGGPRLIYVRRLDQLDAVALAGTENPRGLFFSPDSQWLGFFADAKLKKISVTGGAAVTLCDVPDDRGGAWAEDGTIVFVQQASLGTGIQRVSDSGGAPEQIVPIGAGEAARFPRVLPGGKALLYAATANLSTTDDANIVVQPLPSGTPKIVQRGGYDARYVPSGHGSTRVAERDAGHLVYMHNGTLFAAAFDLKRLELTGSPVPVLEGVTATASAGSALYSVSDTGVLVYLPGQSVGAETAISWLDREGKVTPLRSAPSNWSNPAFSPDGRRLAIDIFDGKQTDIWTYDWERDTLSRLTFDGDDLKPIWTPDGSRIVFRSSRDKSNGNLFWQRADGTGDVQRLTESQNQQSAGSWHPSGKFLAFTETAGASNPDILILPMTGDETSGWKPGKPTDFLRTPFLEFEPMFSPDGRWIAYTSNETGRNQIFVRPFPGPGGKRQISNDGGSYPAWSRVRPELFYLAPGGQIMNAHYAVEGDAFRADKPAVGSVRIAGRPRLRPLALHPDGNRFAIAAGQESTSIAKIDHLIMVLNFFDELRRVAPATKR